MLASFDLFVGIDCGLREYQICVLSQSENVLGEWVVEHSGASLGELASRLLRIHEGDPGGIGVAIENPRGAVVHTLLERGCAVFAINPKQLDRFRDRHTTAGAKDDRRDAFVLADSLRTDQKSFRQVQLDDPLVVQLRGSTREEEELQGDFCRAANQLLAQLHRYYPQLLQLAPAADQQWVWDLLEAAPSPEQGRRLKRSRIQKILRERRIRKFDVQAVVDVLRTPALEVAPGVVEAASSHALRLAKRLRFLCSQQKEVQRRTDQLLEKLTGPEDEEKSRGEHRDAKILLSMPGVGRIVAATILAEGSQPLKERDYHVLRGRSGVAPVTRASGKRSQVVMRRACCNRLRSAVYHMARVASQRDASAKAHYRALRKRGKSHGQATRSVADRLLRIMVAMLNSGSLYDPSRLSGKYATAAVT